jgi:hypothetical protein
MIISMMDMNHTTDLEELYFQYVVTVLGVESEVCHWVTGATVSDGRSSFFRRWVLALCLSVIYTSLMLVVSLLHFPYHIIEPSIG